MDMETYLANNQIFTINELRDALDFKKKNSSLNNLLAYHLQQGHIFRIRKGLYYTIRKGEADASTFPMDPYLIAGKLVPDAVLAYQTSLGFHGKLHSMRMDFIYLTQSKIKPLFAFQSALYKGITMPKATLSNPYLGVDLVEYQKCKIRVTTLERSLVDILYRPSIMGGDWEEIWRSLESIGYINVDKVLEYAQLLDSATTFARVGFFLDQHRDTLSISEKELTFFEKFIPKNPHYLDKQHKGPNKLVSRWNLIIPQTILQKNWEEPYANF